MKSVLRTLTMAEMHGRDLLRHHVAVVLLVVLPLSFYLSAANSHGQNALIAGGVGLAFSISGATLFSILSSREVDQRLVLAGYRPIELLVGRLMFLGPFGLLLASGFAALMGLVSHPARPWLLWFAVVMVALESVPFGLAVGAAVPRELEGTLVLIGVVGLQLAATRTATVSKILPFYGPRRLVDASSVQHGAIAGPLILTAVYGLGLLLVARLLIAGRVNVRRHRAIARTGS